MTPERTMDADHAGMVTDACRALVAAQDSTNESVRILAGHAALVMDEMDALRAALAASESRVKRLREALAPFAHPDLSVQRSSNVMGPDSPIYGRENCTLYLRDFRNARAALAETED